MRKQLALASAMLAGMVLASAPMASAVDRSPATTASVTSITEAQAPSRLPAPERAKWDRLSTSERKKVSQILSEPGFGQPSAAKTLEAKWPEVTVTEASSTGSLSSNLLMTPRATGSRNTWVRQTWTILGITYTEITTTINYNYSGGTVTGINGCYGTYVNYVPLRSIDKTNWPSLSSGIATCKTQWYLSRPLQSTVTGIQGLKVNGYGTILQRWNV